LTPETALRIPLPDGSSVSGLLTARPDGDSRWLLLYAPGAGSSLRDPFGAYLADALPGSGVDVLRFQFPYTEAGRRLPDRTPVLETTWQAAIEAARRPDRQLIATGRSMGGRIASHVAARGAPVAALALFAYPLHPPGKPSQRRDAHLSRIAVPTFFCSGTNDAFGSPDELRAAAALVSGSSIHFLDAAGHGFDASRASGRTRAAIWAEAADALLRWLTSIEAPAGRRVSAVPLPPDQPNPQEA
jgi:hypothetical protein